MTQLSIIPGIEPGAVFSPCRIYRYLLWRKWDPSRVILTWIMLNPSTADERQDDPTIRKCIGFAKAWGYGGVRIVNLFALRATDPDEMKAHEAPIGLANDAAILQACEGAGAIMCAWGKDGNHRGRAAQVLELLKSYHPLCLKVNQDGTPAHPLYISYGTERKPYGGPR